MGDCGITWEKTINTESTEKTRRTQRKVKKKWAGTHAGPRKING